ncbi:sensor histidine kinase [Glaciecola siphonariae]|uniref:histidine kinase n=1 Tax=Glaciecola siphonariae TaxID=521012 RepID=A0ABV9LSX5_9ALTE
MELLCCAMLAIGKYESVNKVQIRSLRQLVLGSYMVALVPLIALLWQSQQDFDDVSYITTVNTQFFVSVASELRDLELVGEDVERLIKGYQVLPNPQLDELADFAIVRFEDKLAFLCDALRGLPECTVMEGHIKKLRDYADFNDQLVTNAHLARFSQSIDILKEQVNSAVGVRISEQQAHLDNIQKRQGWSTGALVLLSLALILVAAQLIVKPVRKLQQIIKAIATNSNKLPARSDSAPRELMAVEKDLFWLNDRLQQLEKVRTALLRHASHELKTPLASIKEGCAILENEVVGTLSSGQSEVVGLLNGSTERLNLLVVKLLDYNALLQQAEPTFEELDITEIIDDCIQQYQLLLSQNKQRVDVEIAKNLSVFSDAELLRRILDNLVSNAIAYAKTESTIYVNVSQDASFTIIDVLNSGKPIGEEARAELFEPFKRGKDKRNDKVMGAGLGLSIVADCARLLHGDVAIEDVSQADVCFRVRLPRRS